MEQLKDQFITACRILENENLATAFFSLSCRIDACRILINSNRGHTLLTEEHILIQSLDDQPQSGTAHHAIYHARSDVNAIVHAHPSYAIALSTVIDKFLPVHHYGTIFHGKINVFEGIGQVKTGSRARQILECLGNGQAILQRGHGTLVVGKTLAEAVLATLYLEESAKIYFLAQTMGRPQPIPKNMSQRISQEIFKERSNQKAWDFYVSRLKNVTEGSVTE
jgi:L-fuculose-phosphate aldolase